MQKKQSEYIYFISYISAGGYANLEISLEEPVKNIDMIRGIELEIEEQFELQHVVIMNYQLLREE